MGRRSRPSAPPIDAPVVDSHCHLEAMDTPFTDGEPPRVEDDIEEAWRAGLSRIVAIGSGNGLHSAGEAIRLAAAHPGRIHPTVGLHPHEASLHAEMGSVNLRGALRALARMGDVVAMGEAGLDFHYDLSPRQDQRDAFRMQIRLALELGLPLVVHDRDSGGECTQILKEEGAFMGKGVLFHCYSGALGDMEEILSLGGYLSIPGVVTWPRSQKLHEVATRVPSDRFLVETDAPYLSPEPWRGHRNRPALILYTIHAIARLRGASAEWVAARTAENAVRFFGLDRPR